VNRIQDPTDKTIKSAIALLRSGKLVALPTETVYGLAADARNEEAVKAIYSVKGRPSHNPLIAHIFDPNDAGDYGVLNPTAHALIEAFWPGPLTLVLPKKTSNLSDIAGAGLDTLAMRCPDTIWRERFLVSGYRGPIYMPSANRSGKISPTTAKHVEEDLGDDIALIVDGGACENGIESTVLKMEDDHVVLLRPGAIPVEALVPFISDLRLPEDSARPSAPGMLDSHYAPKAQVRLNATDKRNDEAYLGFGPTDIEADFNLSPSGDLKEAAQNLYAALRMLDNQPTIAVAHIPDKGLGEAINDRLRRAAADRE